MRRFLPILLVVPLMGCAGFLSFLERSGQDIANAAMSCVPAGVDPSFETVARCVADVAGLVIDHAAEQRVGRDAIECARAARRVESLELVGAESEDLAAERAEVERLVNEIVELTQPR